VCPYRLRIFSLTLIGKGKEREDASHVRRRATSGIIAQIWPNPRRGGVKAKHSPLSQLEIILRVKLNLQGALAIAIHHDLHDHHTGILCQEVTLVSHPLVMVVIVIMLMCNIMLFIVQCPCVVMALIIFYTHKK
jgi:hypothetical protein